MSRINSEDRALLTGKAKNDEQSPVERIARGLIDAANYSADAVAT
jgi:hypothetical protein